MNATQNREADEGVQARGWEIKQWSPTSSSRRLDLGKTQSLQAYRLGYQAYSLGDANAAFDHFRSAIETDPNCVKAHRWFGRVALELGLGAEAERSFETLIRLQGYSAALGQSHEYAVEVSRFGLEAASGFRAGCEAQKTGQLNDASLAFGRVVASAPNHQRAWARLGQILLELKSYDGAVIACERALALEPYDSGSSYRLRLASKHTVSRAAGASLEEVLDPKTPVSIQLSMRGRR